MPSTYNVIKEAISSFRHLHYEDGVLYSLPNCRIFEMKGKEEIYLLVESEREFLINHLSSLSRTDSVLDVIYIRYLEYAERNKKNKKQTLVQFIKKFLSTNPNIDIGEDETDEDVRNDLDILRNENYLYSINTYQRALIFSLYFLTLPYGLKNKCLLQNLKNYKTPRPFICHLDISTNTKYFGLPIHFFRANMTSAVENMPMIRIRWVPFIIDSDNRTATIGRIKMTDWNNPEWSTNKNPYISFSELQSSRYALSYNPNIQGSVFVDCAFVALDADTLESETYHTEFGDNMFPYYKGKLSDYNIE